MFMLEQHTGEKTAEANQATLEVWGLQETFQVRFTTDSGSNIINSATDDQIDQFWMKSFT